MSDETETKGGHLPAVKVGGMRISQRGDRSSSSDAANQDPENPQIPPKDNDTAGDSAVQGIGGLQSKPKDLLVKGTSGIPVTAKDLEIQNTGVKHTHDKGINQNKLSNKEHNTHVGVSFHQEQPRNHGTNH